MKMGKGNAFAVLICLGFGSMTFVDALAQSDPNQGTVLKGGTDASLTATPIVSTQRRAAAPTSPQMPVFQSRIPQVPDDDARRMQAEIDKAKYSLNATTDLSIPRPQRGAVQDPVFRPRYAPDDMQRALQAEIDKAKRFQSGTPTPSIHTPTPAQFFMPPLGLPSGSSFDSARAAQELEMERRKANFLPGAIPQGQPRVIISPSDIALLDEQLARAKKLNNNLPVLNFDKDVYGKLVSKQLEDELAAERVKAKHYQDRAATTGNSELKRVFSRLVSPSSVGTIPQQDDNNPLWDSWYQRIATLTEPLVYRSSENNGNPSGANTIEVCVTQAQEVTVRIVRPSNSAFDQAILTAYSAINHNPSLKFPPGSNQQVKVFMVDNTHSTEGPVSDVVTRTLKGDRDAR